MNGRLLIESKKGTAKRIKAQRPPSIGLLMHDYVSGIGRVEDFPVYNLSDATRVFKRLKGSRRIAFGTSILTANGAMEISGYKEEVTINGLTSWRAKLIYLLKEAVIASHFYPFFVKTYLFGGDYQAIDLDWQLSEEFVNAFGPDEQLFVLEFWKYNRIRASQLPGALLDVDDYQKLGIQKELWQYYKMRGGIIRRIDGRIQNLSKMAETINSSDTDGVDSSNTFLHDLWISDAISYESFIHALERLQLIRYLPGKKVWRSTQTDLGFLIEKLKSLNCIGPSTSDHQIVHELWVQSRRAAEAIKFTPQRLKTARENSKGTGNATPEIAQLMRYLTKLLKSQ